MEILKHLCIISRNAKQSIAIQKSLTIYRRAKIECDTIINVGSNFVPVVKREKQLKYLSVDERIGEMWCMSKMEYVYH